MHYRDKTCPNCLSDAEYRQQCAVSWCSGSSQDFSETANLPGDAYSPASHTLLAAVFELPAAVLLWYANGYIYWRRCWPSTSVREVQMPVVRTRSVKCAGIKATVFGNSLILSVKARLPVLRKVRVLLQGQQSLPVIDGYRRGLLLRRTEALPLVHVV
jgi:hypothetical protein